MVKAGAQISRFCVILTSMSKDDGIRLNWITGIKGACALVIAFLWHYKHFIAIEYAPMYRLFFFSCHYGDILVDLFFCLSGLSIFLGYGDRIRTITFKDFMLKRIRKLYPPMLTGLLLTTAFEWLYIRHEGVTFVYDHFDIKHFLLNVLGLQGGIFNRDLSFNGPAWTITVFLMLYVLFWVISKITRSNKGVLVIYCVLTVASEVIILMETDHPMINSFTARGLMGFSTGVIMAYMYKDLKVVDRIPSGVLRVLCLVDLIIIMITYVMIRQGIRPFSAKEVIRSWVVFMLFPSLFLLACGVPVMEKILSSRVLMFLGGISLYIYLLHFPVQCIFALCDKYIYTVDYSNITVWLVYITVCIMTSFAYKITADAVKDRYIFMQVTDHEDIGSKQ